MHTAQAPCLTTFLLYAIMKKARRRGNQGCVLAGTEHCYAAGYPNATKNQSCGVTRACPPLRATRKIPYNIRENNVTENRPLLHDHFGLDTLDLSEEKFLNMKAGYFPAFRQWYILQHWNGLGYTSQPKPFVTIVSFTVGFSGTC